MKSLLIVVLSCVACGTPREERKCDVVIDGICINKGMYELSNEDIQYVVDVTYYHYSWVYDVEFNFPKLAEDRDLYVMFMSREKVKEYCGIPNGCYIYSSEEIIVNKSYVNNVSISSSVLKEKGLNLKTLSHELLHFWNRHYLKSVQSELFGSDFDETEVEHLAPGMFGMGDKTSVEGRVWIDIQDYMCWKYGE